MLRVSNAVKWLLLLPRKKSRMGLKTGFRLIDPPPSTEELISLLDVKPPADSMKDALRPVMTAMVRSELLNHTDADVKVSVLSCTQLCRITAPQQPYDDGSMKEIFQLIVKGI
ncbi:hypothetical protein HAX54_011265 [Datura stramonium]|uniref:Uncharacterized protein n=1 Tax=Datura stramonium TaxID=4076 RepID=A0ABS8TKC1_DATST|nr:hypothetical protein [Datura stramonium]